MGREVYNISGFGIMFLQVQKGFLSSYDNHLKHLVACKCIKRYIKINYRNFGYQLKPDFQKPIPLLTIGEAEGQEKEGNACNQILQHTSTNLRKSNWQDLHRAFSEGMRVGSTIIMGEVRVGSTSRNCLIETWNNSTTKFLKSLRFINMQIDY